MDTTDVLVITKQLTTIGKFVPYW